MFSSIAWIGSYVSLISQNCQRAFNASFVDDRLLCSADISFILGDLLDISTIAQVVASDCGPVDDESHSEAMPDDVLDSGGSSCAHLGVVVGQCMEVKWRETADRLAQICLDIFSSFRRDRSYVYVVRIFEAISTYRPPDSGQIWSMLAKPCQMLAKFDRSCPIVTKVNSEFDHIWPDFGRFVPALDNAGPHLAKLRAQSWPRSGIITRPTSANVGLKVQMLVTVGTGSGQAGQTWFGTDQPAQDTCRGMLRAIDPAFGDGQTCSAIFWESSGPFRAFQRFRVRSCSRFRDSAIGLPASGGIGTDCRRAWDVVRSWAELIPQAAQWQHGRAANNPSLRSTRFVVAAHGHLSPSLSFSLILRLSPVASLFLRSSPTGAQASWARREARSVRKSKGRRSPWKSLRQGVAAQWIAGVLRAAEAHGAAEVTAARWGRRSSWGRSPWTCGSPWALQPKKSLEPMGSRGPMEPPQTTEPPDPVEPPRPMVRPEPAWSPEPMPEPMEFPQPIESPEHLEPPEPMGSAVLLASPQCSPPPPGAIVVSLEIRCRPPLAPTPRADPLQASLCCPGAPLWGIDHGTDAQKAPRARRSGAVVRRRRSAPQAHGLPLRPAPQAH